MLLVSPRADQAGRDQLRGSWGRYSWLFLRVCKPPLATPNLGTKRRKPAAADPWQALPRLAGLFDRDTPQPFFKGSKIPELEELALTETQLLEQTAALLGASLAQLVKAGTLVYAKRDFLNHKKYSDGDSEVLLRSGSGVAGVADARIQAAYESLADRQAAHHPASSPHEP